MKFDRHQADRRSIGGAGERPHLGSEHTDGPTLIADGPIDHRLIERCVAGKRKAGLAPQISFPGLAGEEKRRAGVAEARRPSPGADQVGLVGDGGE